MAPSIAAAVQASIASRAPLIASLHAEQTDCYRLLHGAMEGLPGVTLDRYNRLLLLQTFREPPPGLLDDLADVHAAVSEALGLELEPVYWCDRRRGAPSGGGPAPLLPVGHTATELGLRYLIDAPPQGRDPGLYLDFRVARRWLRDNSAGRDVLNAFASAFGCRRTRQTGPLSAALRAHDCPRRFRPHTVRSPRP